MINRIKNMQVWLLSGLCSVLMVACPSPDVQPPKVALSPSSKTINAGNNPLILTAVASDNVGVQKVEFFDGTTLLGTKDAEPYVLEVNLTANQDGIRQYKAKAYDVSNNSAESALVSVNVALTPVPDTQAPTVALTASSAVVRATNSLTLTAVAVDNVGVSKVDFFDGTTLLGTKTATPYTWSMTFDASQNGIRTFSAKAYDAANNITTSDNVPVTIDLSSASAMDASILSGTVPDWLRGQRTLRMVNPDFTAALLSQGVINPTGAINLVLPDLVENGVALGNLGQALASGCTTTTTTPSDAKGLATLYPLVYKTPQTPTGRLIYSNEAGFSSPLSLNARIVIHIFANKAATVVGSCTFGTSTTEYNANLNRGWNTAIFETTNTGTRVFSGPVPNDVSWRYMPNAFKSVQILNKPTRLEVGKATALQVLIKDSEDFTVTDMQPVWSVGSDPSLASITPQGVITANKLTNITVGASLPNSGSDSFTASTFGMQVIGGTMNVENQSQLGSAFAAKILLPNSANTALVAPSSSGTIQIRGPASWNGGQPLSFTYAANAQYAWDARNTPFVAGEYTATATIGASSYQNTFTVVEGTPTPLTTNVEVKDRSTSTVKMTWGSSFGTPGYWEGRLFSGTTQLSSVALNSGFANGLDFTGLSLLPSGTYQAVLYQFPTGLNFTFPSTFNISSVSRTFDLRPLISSLSFNAVSANTSGLLLTINGQGFSNDSTVQFGSTNATSISVVNPSRIDVTVPTGGTGTVDVIVSNVAGTSTPNNASKFKFYTGSEYTVVSGFASINKIAAAPDGTAWFVNTSSFPSQLVNITATGTLSTYNLSNCPNFFGVNDIEVSSTGVVWMSGGSFNGGLCSFNAGTFTSYPLPVVGFSSSTPGALAVDANGDVWFQYSGQSKMGKLTVATSSITDYTLPTTSTFSSSSDVLIAGDGNVWFSGIGSQQLGKVNPNTGAVNLYTPALSASFTSFTEQGGQFWFISSGKLYSSSYAGVAQEVSMNNLPANFYSSFIMQSSANNVWSYSGVQLIRMNPATNQAENIVVTTAANFSGGISSFSVRGNQVWYTNGGKVGVVNF